MQYRLLPSRARCRDLDPTLLSARGCEHHADEKGLSYEIIILSVATVSSDPKLTATKPNPRLRPRTPARCSPEGARRCRSRSGERVLLQFAAWMACQNANAQSVKNTSRENHASPIVCTTNRSMRAHNPKSRRTKRRRPFGLCGDTSSSTNKFPG